MTAYLTHHIAQRLAEEQAERYRRSAARHGLRARTVRPLNRGGRS